MTKAKKLSNAAAAAVVVCVGAFILTKPAAAAKAVSEAVGNCLEVIVPSLFAFTVLAVFLRDSGLYRIVLKPLALALSRLLRMDEELCAYIILGNIGGYPVGIKLLSRAVEERRLSANDAGRLMCCCFGSGPSFVIGIVGMRVFDSAAAGGAVFAACFVSSIIMAAIVRSRGEIKLSGERQPCAPSAQCFIGAVTSAARVMFTVCAMITAFSVIMAFLESTGLMRLPVFFGEEFIGIDAGTVFLSILEVSKIGELSVKGMLSAPLCAALLSFGGVCVLLQIAALSGEIPLKRFVLTRPLAAVFSAVCAIPAGFIPRSAAAALPANTQVQPFSASAAASACVLIMCAILLSQERFSTDA